MRVRWGAAEFSVESKRDFTCMTAESQFYGALLIIEKNEFMRDYDVILNRMTIIISRVALWKNGNLVQMTLYCVVIVAGEQTEILRLSAHHVKSIIV
jgi:hypothetical protein